MPNPKDLSAATLAGLLASGLFLIIFGIGLGFLFMFLPTLPLFFLGLGKRPHTAPIATIIAAVLIALAAGIPAAILFLLFLGLPALYISHKSLLSKPGMNGQRIWFPIGRITVELVIYASILIAATTWYYSGIEGGLPHLISQNIHEAFADLKDEYGDVIETMAGELSFIMLPVTIWLWAMTLYAHAWITNRFLVSRHKEHRPDFRVEVFIMPGWMLTLLAICGLASLIGGESMGFLGKSALISLLLPYFFEGAALLHVASKKWSSPRIFLFFIYFVVFSQFWPALIVAGIGLWHQIKHLSPGSSWFKS